MADEQSFEVKYSMRQLIYIFDHAYFSIKLEWEQFSILNEDLQKLDMERFANNVAINYSILEVITDAVTAQRLLPQFMQDKLDSIAEILLVTAGHTGNQGNVQ